MWLKICDNMIVILFILLYIYSIIIYMEVWELP